MPVTQIIAGTNITIFPLSGVGVVTICAAGGISNAVIDLDSGTCSSYRINVNNCANGIASAALGGCGNSALSNCSSVLGGKDNAACSVNSIIYGGLDNQICGANNVITSGISNCNLTSDSSTVIIGGCANVVRSPFAVSSSGTGNISCNSCGSVVFSKGSTNCNCESPLSTAFFDSGSINVCSSCSISNGYASISCCSPLSMIMAGKNNRIIGGACTASIFSGCCNFIECDSFGFIGSGCANCLCAVLCASENGSLVSGLGGCLGGFDDFLGSGFQNTTGVTSRQTIVTGFQSKSNSTGNFVGTACRSNLAGAGAVFLAGDCSNYTTNQGVQFSGCCLINHNFGTMGTGECNRLNLGFVQTIYGVLVNGKLNCGDWCMPVIFNGECNAVDGSCGCGRGWRTIFNGCANTICGDFSTISNGYNNCVSNGNFFSTVGNGVCNFACGYSEVINAGCCNCSTGCLNAIGNGFNNTHSGCYNAISGGVNNSDGGCCNVFILGSNITADTHCATYVNRMSIKNIPTSAVGLCAGMVYRTGSVLNIV